MDEQQYKDGANKMIKEGLEVATLIKNYIKDNASVLQELNEKDRKQMVINADERFSLFHQIHPIVFQYIAVEGVFNTRAFERYVMCVFGKPKPVEVQEKMAKDKSYVFFYKNEQQALYYKYLILETNKHLTTQQAHEAYEHVVETMNSEIRRLLDTYKQAEERSKNLEKLSTEEKRKEIIDLLRNASNN